MPMQYVGNVYSFPASLVAYPSQQSQFHTLEINENYQTVSGGQPAASA